MNSKTISHCCHPHSGVREFAFFARSNDLALSDLPFVFQSINKQMKDWNVPCMGGGWRGQRREGWRKGGCEERGRGKGVAGEWRGREGEREGREGRKGGEEGGSGEGKKGSGEKDGGESGGREGEEREKGEV